MRDKKALNKSRKVPDERFVKLCVSIKTHKRDHLTSACMNTVGMETVVLFCTLVLRQFCDDLSRRNVYNTDITNDMHDIGALSKFREVSAVLDQDAPNSIEDLQPES